MPFDETQSDRYLFFELKVAGEVFQIYDYLESFTYGFGAEKDQKAVIQLFDPTWTTLTDLAEKIQTKSRDVTFRFGWNDRPSPVYEGHALQPEPEFEHEGMTLTLTLTSKVAGPTNWNTETRSWPTGTKPHEIAQYVSELMGFTETIIEETDPWTFGPIIMDRVHPFNWLKKTFGYSNAKNPVTTAGGQRAGFEVMIDGLGRFHFHSRTYKSNIVVRDYLYARDIQGQVLGFSPVDNSNMWALFTGSQIESTGFDTRKKQFVVKTASNESTQIDTIDGKAIQPIEIRSGTRRRHTNVYRDPGAVDKDVKSKWSTAADFTYVAELEILGDPFINVTDLVRVTVLMPNNKPFPLSGIFRVNAVEHQLDSSGFVTTLTIHKMGMLYGPDELGAANQLKATDGIPPEHDANRSTQARSTKQSDKNEQREVQIPSDSGDEAAAQIADRVRAVRNQHKAFSLQEMRDNEANDGARDIVNLFTLCLQYQVPTDIYTITLIQIYEAVQQIVNGVVRDAVAKRAAENAVVVVIREDMGDFGTLVADYVKSIFDDYQLNIDNDGVARLEDEYGPLDTAHEDDSTAVFVDCAWNGISAHIDDLDTVFPGISSTVKDDIATIIETQLDAWLINVQAVIECVYGLEALVAFNTALTQPVTDGVSYVAGVVESSIDSYGEKRVREIVAAKIDAGVLRVEEAIA